jgi:hypothetical protein
LKLELAEQQMAEHQRRMVDYDNDGKLDLFVSQLHRWSPELDRAAPFELPNIGRSYGPPRNFEGVFPYLYHNDGVVTLRTSSAAAGIQVRNSATGRPVAKSLAVAPSDVDNDGWIDLVSPMTPCKTSSFTMRAGLERRASRRSVRESGIAYDAYVPDTRTMGIDFSKVS